VTTSPAKGLDRLLEVVLNADGEVRLQLVEANTAALLSEPAFHRVNQQRDESERRVKRLEAALAEVRRLQEDQSEGDDA